LLGAAHFAAHTRIPSRSPTGYEGPAGAYLFTAPTSATGRVPDCVARCRGRFCGKCGRRLHAGQPRRVTELAALAEVLSLNAAEAAALTGPAEPASTR